MLKLRLPGLRLATRLNGARIVHFIYSGVTGYNSNNIVFLFLKIDFVLANSGYFDKMLQPAAFYIGINGLPT